MARIPDDVLAVVRKHRAALSRFDNIDRERLAVLSERTRRRLAYEMRGLDVGSFRRSQAALASVLAEVARLDVTGITEEVLLESLANSSALAYVDALDELETWGAHHGHELRAPNLDAALEFDGSLEIERHEQSLKTYGSIVANRIRITLADSTLAFTSKEQVIDKITEIIDGERWRAERIVRTETMTAYNNAFHDTLQAARDTGWTPDVQKTCIVTFDERTDRDSFPLDGQVRDLDEPFVDGDGRRYISPPGRPNDREKEIPWLPPLDGDGPTLEQLDPSVLPEEGAAHTEQRVDQVRDGLTEAMNERRAAEGRDPLDPPDMRADLMARVAERDRLLDELARRNELTAGEVARRLGLDGGDDAIDDDVDLLAATLGELERFPETPDELTVVQRLGGSTGAELVEDSQGRRFVRKFGGSPEHLEEEMRADAIYQALGVPVPPFRRYEVDGRPMKLAEFIPGKSLRDVIDSGDRRAIQKVKRQLQNDFVVDGLLANWDVVGLSLDNVLVAEDGTAYRIDNGGALRFRAQGQPKGGLFGENPLDVWTLRDAGVNRESASVFGEMRSGKLWSKARGLKRRAGAGFLRSFETPRLDGVDVDQELAELLAARADNLDEMGKLELTLTKDRFRPEYADAFTREIQELRAAGITAKLPEKMTPEKNRRHDPNDERSSPYDSTDVRDENGVKWDKLRGKDSTVFDLVEHMKNRGGDYAIARNYARDQGMDSWNGQPAAFKYWWATEARDLDEPDEHFFWRYGFADAGKHFEKLEADKGARKLRQSYTTYHAFTYEMLRKADSPNKNADGNLSLIRTEFYDLPKLSFPDAKVGEKVNYTIGPMESSSAYSVVYVYGHHFMRFDEVPKHRVFCSYWHESDAGLSNKLLLGDHENEYTVDLSGIEAKWVSDKKL